MSGSNHTSKEIYSFTANRRNKVDLWKKYLYDQNSHYFIRKNRYETDPLTQYNYSFVIDFINILENYILENNIIFGTIFYKLSPFMAAQQNSFMYEGFL